MNDLSHTGIISPLTFEAVSVSHRGQPLLHPLDLRLSGCRRTLVMGPNGAGKSLLLRLAHGLLPPSGGRIRWEGSTPRQAMVFQRPVLLRRSALANLTYALAVNGTPRRQRQALAMEALDHFGLASLARRPARVLSGGEQQRLALARAWLLRPQVLFLDEPTAALDPAAIKAVEAAVLDFHRRGTRIVMTSHDLHQARRLADEVILLNGGRLVEQSDAATFFREPRSDEGRAFLRGERVW
ncbi:energy-coupling factor ABC transporter ATP-binding protein [Halomonas sp. 328]|uniref:energy-coupling factor ABC transporter ATP-binding protein n=1 Tax=Halomonas sp. 328 TaxID=2776704 RepID=UPI0018A72D6D|nr:ATP-binding cassette domain-containing protein [Halomonas sp. 328]MBF8221219.1 amino acid ABC transporter ATP-binding protein [Halomonas sp. 328]